MALSAQPADVAQRVTTEIFAMALEGATMRLPPTNYPWALEMQAEDPDGNVLRFGSDPE